jgi:lipopolysaccharide/colanic/teichoic acid biosynthesis glycosyltransferase
VGKGGAVFTLWKFRTMTTDAEARLAELRAQAADAASSSSRTTRA